MHQFSNISLRQKLFGAFGAILLLLLAVGSIGWKYTQDLGDDYNRLYDDRFRGAVYLANAQDALWQLRYGFPQFMVSDGEARAKIVAEEPKLHAIVDENLKA